MVEAVARLRERQPEIVDKTFEASARSCTNARLAIEAGDRIALGRLMDLNQMLLGGPLRLDARDRAHVRARARCRRARARSSPARAAAGASSRSCRRSAVADAVLAAWKAEGFEGFATCGRPRERARRRAVESETAP